MKSWYELVLEALKNEMGHIKTIFENKPTNWQEKMLYTYSTIFHLLDILSATHQIPAKDKRRIADALINILDQGKHLDKSVRDILSELIIKLTLNLEKE